MSSSTQDVKADAPATCPDPSLHNGGRGSALRDWIERRWFVVEVCLAILTIGLLWINYQAIQDENERERNEAKLEAFANLTANVADSSAGVRLATTYGLGQFAETYPETRRQITQILSSQLRSHSHRYFYDEDEINQEGLPPRPEGYTEEEARVVRGVLNNISTLGGWPRNVPKTFDISNVYFSTGSMRGLTMVQGEAVNTVFSGTTLSGMRWECVHAQGARFLETYMENAVFDQVNLSNADFTGISQAEALETLNSVEFRNVWWVEGQKPKFPPGFAIPDEEKADEEPTCLN